jgi:hypothetical protein
MDFPKVEYPAGNITDQEFNILELAKKANPWWFQVMMMCAKVMVDRRAKYAGDNHPYHNFFDVSKRSEVSVEDVFKVYVAMKQSRSEATPDQDFADESHIDTEIDKINYAWLKAGAVLSEMTAEEVLDG